jgi:hypothetical protein
MFAKVNVTREPVVFLAEQLSTDYTDRKVSEEKAVTRLGKMSSAVF